MECFLQYLDDLDDLFYAVALTGEKIRRVMRFLLFLSIAGLAQGLGIYLAVAHPPAAVASGSLLLVLTLYHGAVHRGRDLSGTA